MSEEKNEKRCSGCKTPKTIDNFYKNKLVLDGHSNYCIDCTRENSRKYFQRKKEKQSKSETDSLMKVLMIERLLKSVTEELSTLKKNLTNSDMFISQ